MATYVIADTHFGHKWMAHTRGFNNVDEHDEILVQRWNDTVGKRDIVWHLGDVAFSVAGLNIIGRLNGIKRLVMGNHDNYPLGRYSDHFAVLRGAVQIKCGVMTHIPVSAGQLGRFAFNIHGHLHARRIDSPCYRCVSCEQVDFKPILLDEVIDEIRAAYQP